MQEKGLAPWNLEVLYLSLLIDVYLDQDRNLYKALLWYKDTIIQSQKDKV